MISCRNIFLNKHVKVGYDGQLSRTLPYHEYIESSCKIGVFLLVSCVLASLKNVTIINLTILGSGVYTNIISKLKLKKSVRFCRQANHISLYPSLKGEYLGFDQPTSLNDQLETIPLTYDQITHLEIHTGIKNLHSLYKNKPFPCIDQIKIIYKPVISFIPFLGGYYLVDNGDEKWLSKYILTDMVDRLREGEILVLRDEANNLASVFSDESGSVDWYDQYIVSKFLDIVPINKSKTPTKYSHLYQLRLSRLFQDKLIRLHPYHLPLVNNPIEAMKLIVIGLDQ